MKIQGFDIKLISEKLFVVHMSEKIITAKVVMRIILKKIKNNFFWKFIKWKYIINISIFNETNFKSAMFELFALSLQTEAVGLIGT